MASREEYLKNLPSNSHNTKGNVGTRKIQPVAQARVGKKSLGKKFVESIIEDNVTNVADYVWNDVLIPNIKNSLIDIVEGAIEMIFNGERRAPSSSNAYHVSSKPKTSYTSYYKSEATSSTRATNNGKYMVRDIIVNTKEDANAIFSAMADAIGEYGQASVGDLYDAVGITDSSFQDQNWGWTTMAGAGVKRVNDGFLLVLPKCESLL